MKFHILDPLLGKLVVEADNVDEAIAVAYSTLQPEERPTYLCFQGQTVSYVLVRHNA